MMLLVKHFGQSICILLHDLTCSPPAVAPRKFLVLVYQLTSRLLNSDNQFQHSLVLILQAILTAHPHHIVYHLIALKTANFERLFKKDPPPLMADVKSRMKAAEKVLSKAPIGKTSEIVHQSEKLAYAYNQLAYYTEESTNDRATFEFNPRLEIVKISNYDQASVPTVDVPINGDHVVTVREFKSKFSLVGGINKPKKVECVGIDGNIYTQLVKGKDDLRQDAVLSVRAFSIFTNTVANISSR